MSAIGSSSFPLVMIVFGAVSKDGEIVDFRV